MPFLMCTNIDSQRLDVETREEAIEKFKEKVERYKKMGIAIKDYYLCEIIAIDANWDEQPRGFTILSDSEGKEK